MAQVSENKRINRILQLSNILEHCRKRDSHCLHSFFHLNLTRWFNCAKNTPEILSQTAALPLTLIGQIMAMSAPEILTARRKVELPNPPPTGLPFFRKRAYKPAPEPSKMTGVFHNPNSVVHVVYLS